MAKECSKCGKKIYFFQDSYNGGSLCGDCYLKQQRETWEKEEKFEIKDSTRTDKINYSEPKTMKKKNLFISIGIVAILIIIVSSAMIINSNNSKKYLEVAKRVLPIMEQDYIDAQKIDNNLKKEILYYTKSMSKEMAINEVKSTTSYQSYVFAIDKHLSEQYKDLEYLKKHSYSKNKDLSKQIKNIVNEYESEMKCFRELELHYGNDEKGFYEKIREVQNLINKE